MPDSLTLPQPADADTNQAAKPEPKPDACLGELVAALSVYIGQPKSRASLVSGLPLEDGRIGYSQLPAMARRAGLNCRKRQIALKKVAFLDLPLLIQLGDAAAVLLSIDGDEAQLLTASGGVQRQPLAELQADYTGEAWSLQPAVQATGRQQYQAPAGNWFWRLIWSARRSYMEAAFGSIIVNMLALVVPLFVMTVYDRIIPNQALESLTVLATGVLMVAGVDFLLRSLRAHIIDTSGKRIEAFMGNQVFNHVLNAKSQQAASGNTANAIREMDVLREFMNSATVTLLADLPFLVLFVGVVYWIGGELALVPAVLIPLTLLVFALTQWPMHRVMKRAYENASHRNSVLFEVLNGMETLKSVGGHSWAATQWEKAHAAGVKTTFQMRRFTQMNQHFLMFVQTVSTVALLIFGVIKIGAGELSFGALFACVILTGRAMAPLSQISQVIGRLHAVQIAWKSINELMQLPLEKGELTEAVSMPAVRGEIVCEQLKFSYATPGTMFQQEVISDLSFKIAAGEKVAILGTIGSGKTTLLRLIMNKLDPASGTLRIDGVDVREIHPADLRANIGYVPQNLQFFRGSIKDNLTLGAPNCPDADILRAASIAGVSDWLAHCPLGLSQPVAERGDSLSGGQKQSLALARALINDPPILLMDEPSSQLDSQNERQFVERLKDAIGDKTLIVATHRPAMLALVDRIIVMDKGKVAVDGPKHAVLKKLGGAA